MLYTGQLVDLGLTVEYAVGIFKDKPQFEVAFTLKMGEEVCSRIFVSLKIKLILCFLNLVP